MSKERPFEDIVPVQNIKVGYFEKEAYLEIIDRQAKQIESFAYQIMALQSRIDRLEKSQRPHGKWIHGTRLDGSKYCRCSECDELAGCDYDGNHEESDYCSNCGAKMDGGKENEN